MSGALFLKQAEGLKKQVFAAASVPAVYIVVGGVATGISNAATATDFTIPSTVTSIEFSFATVLAKKVANLKSITIPATVTSIGDNVFKDCTALKTVTFVNPKTLARLGLGIFTNTPYLAAWAADLPLLLTKTSPVITLF